MKTRRYDGLRDKLVQPFVLLAFIVSAALSLTTFALLANIEERAIERALKTELESFRHRLANNSDALPANSSLLQGVFLPSDKLPAYQMPVLTGETIEIRTVDDADYSILSVVIEGRPFALLYDRSYIKSSLADLALLLLIATGVLTFLSYLIGERLASKLVRPIVRLLGDVSNSAARQDIPAEPPRFSASDYPADEVGDLVRELDRYSVRLHEFVRRESYFASDVSHELRTPVAVISGIADVLSELPELPERVRSRVTTIQRQTTRMACILDAMLWLSQEERNDGDPSCSLADVIDDAVADCTPALLGRPVLIEVRVVERRILPVERSLAYVLVSNVLRNACAYTREGRIELCLDKDCLTISDTGIGIPKERFPELFLRHAKGEDSAGYGLGLSIVDRISTRLHWQVDVRSQAGEGTQFRFVFPVER